jgi:hypothetical protein
MGLVLKTKIIVDNVVPHAPRKVTKVRGFELPKVAGLVEADGRLPRARPRNGGDKGCNVGGPG